MRHAMGERQAQEVVQQGCQGGCRGTMTGLPRAGALSWTRCCSMAQHQVLMFVLAVTAEFVRANAATERYEQLRLAICTRDDPNASPARRVFVEFYAGR